MGPVRRPTPPASVPARRTLVLVANPHAGRARRGLRRAEAAIARAGLVVRETLPVSDLGRLRPWLDRLTVERPLIVAAGGDGTVGAVADALAHSDAALGIVPLGTSNDVARSLDIPLDIGAAVRLLATGPISTVDLGRFEAPDAAPRHFVHAAALGLNVAFARVATRVSVRKRLGRFTYMVAASALIRRREAFRCVLSLDDGDRSLPLSQLVEGGLHPPFAIPCKWGVPAPAPAGATQHRGLAPIPRMGRVPPRRDGSPGPPAAISTTTICLRSTTGPSGAPMR